MGAGLPLPASTTRVHGVSPESVLFGRITGARTAMHVGMTGDKGIYECYIHNGMYVRQVFDVEHLNSCTRQVH
jgi:hypothetical protein